MLVSSFGERQQVLEPKENHRAQECFSLQQSVSCCLLLVTSGLDSLRRFTQPFLIRMPSRQPALAWEVMRSSARVLYRACYSADNESRVPTAGPEDPGFNSVDSDCHRIAS